jgi:hypothetical protein
VAATSVADLIKSQDGCCVRCPTSFAGLAGKLEDVVYLVTMHFALVGPSVGHTTRGKVAVVCPACAREIDRECVRG